MKILVKSQERYLEDKTTALILSEKIPLSYGGKTVTINNKKYLFDYEDTTALPDVFFVNEIGDFVGKYVEFDDEYIDFNDGRFYDDEIININ